MCSDTETVDETIQVVCSDMKQLMNGALNGNWEWASPRRILLFSPRETSRFDMFQDKVRGLVLQYKETSNCWAYTCVHVYIPLDEDLDVKRYIAITEANTMNALNGISEVNGISKVYHLKNNRIFVDGSQWTRSRRMIIKAALWISLMGHVKFCHAALTQGRVGHVPLLM